MKESRFWKIIDTARKQAGEDIHSRETSIIEQLTRLSERELTEFHYLYFLHELRAYSWELWGALFIINQGDTDDDNFQHFISWLISEGKATYQKIIENPELLANREELDEIELTPMTHIAEDVYKEKTGDDIPAHCCHYPEEPMGEAWDETDVIGKYPKLEKKYWS
ncbi:MAG: DUF4240 domain-containing protein [Gammaproteobacteria bacterium]|nr:DUF4240 domain-containing protein [Gammaproteobacteria bacterium]